MTFSFTTYFVVLNVAVAAVAGFTTLDTTTHGPGFGQRPRSTVLYQTAETTDSRDVFNFGVTLKIAVDKNGGVAELGTSDSERFTSPESLDMVHRLRRDVDAVLVGKSTVQADNPSLTVRRVEPLVDPNNGAPKQPIRVVLDPNFVLGLEQSANEKVYQLFEDGLPTVVYHTLADVDLESLAILDSVEFVRLPTVAIEHNEIITEPASTNPPRPDAKLLSVANVMSDLSQRYNVKHLMVEGGAITAQTFLRAGLVDRALIVKAPISFRQPLASGITEELLRGAGLELLGTYDSGADEIECWSRPHIAWPAQNIEEWP